MSFCRFFVLTYVMLTLGISTASAHVRSESFSHWKLDGETVSVQIKVPARDLAAMGQINRNEPRDFRNLWVERVLPTFSLRVDQIQCEQTGPIRIQGDLQGNQFANLSFRCPPGDKPQLSIQPIFSALPGHIHFGSVQFGDGEMSDFVLTARRPSFVFPPVSSALRPIVGLIAYLVTGVQHIWTGWDHLAFLIGVFLVARGHRKRLLLLVTGFTVGHSISLSLSATGMIDVDRHAIEAMIGFSILLLGMEHSFATRAGVRRLSVPLVAMFATLAAVSLLHEQALPVMTILGIAIFTLAFMSAKADGAPTGLTSLLVVVFFGLIHGVAFADLLREFDVSNDRLVSRLIAFNLGVEVAQILLLLGFVALSRILLRLNHLGAGLLRFGQATVPAALIFAGTFWFITRSIG